MNKNPPKYLHVKVTINGSELYTSGFDEAEVMIGRGSDCQVLLENAGVSRNHAKLLWDENGITVVDLLSGNGTFVNGKQVETATLEEGDTLRIGKFTLYVKLSSQALGVSPLQTPSGGDINTGTVFLRPEERNKILHQAALRKTPTERVATPIRVKNTFDWKSAIMFFALGTAFGVLCTWVISG
jgi:pSer/pThr/pTyr-binding forkhead associated (FHA) protein